MSYLSAALSCEQRPFFSSDPAFLRNIVVLRDPKLNPVTSQIGRIAGTNPIGIGEKG